MLEKRIAGTEKDLEYYKSTPVPMFNYAHMTKEEIDEKVQWAAGILGIEELLDTKPAEMSGGENQRIAVARALTNHPDVILADEPSGSLDSHNKEELHKLFFDLRDKFGQTFIIVTHDETLAKLTDRTIRMVDGTIAE